MSAEKPTHPDLIVATCELEDRADELREEAAELEQQNDDPDSPYQSPQERAGELRDRADQLERCARWLEEGASATVKAWPDAWQLKDSDGSKCAECETLLVWKERGDGAILMRCLTCNGTHLKPIAAG